MRRFLEFWHAIGSQHIYVWRGVIWDNYLLYFNFFFPVWFACIPHFYTMDNTKSLYVSTYDYCLQILALTAYRNSVLTGTWVNADSIQIDWYFIFCSHCYVVNTFQSASFNTAMNLEVVIFLSMTCDLAKKMAGTISDSLWSYYLMKWCWNHQQEVRSHILKGMLRMMQQIVIMRYQQLMVTVMISTLRVFFCLFVCLFVCFCFCFVFSVGLHHLQRPHTLGPIKTWSMVGCWIDTDLCPHQTQCGLMHTGNLYFPRIIFLALVWTLLK